ncbi:hypothetical protein Tco_0366699 [Tanacetum coccineum]
MSLTKKSRCLISFIKQIGGLRSYATDDNGEVQITATIDGHSMSITEASLRRHLKLDDHDDVYEPSTSPSRITSSPSHSPEPSPSSEPSIEHSPASSFEQSPDHTTAAPTQPSPTQPSPTQLSPTQPSPTQPSTGAEHHFPTPHDSHLACCSHLDHKEVIEGKLEI